MHHKVCNGFAPTDDPVRCTHCRQRLSDHSKDIRQAYYRTAPEDVMAAQAARLVYLKQDNPARCQSWRPQVFGDYTVCACGRILMEHNFKIQVQVKSIARITPEPPATEPVPHRNSNFGFYTRAKGQCDAFKVIDLQTKGYCYKADGHIYNGDLHHTHASPRLNATWKETVTTGLPVRATSACETFTPLVNRPGHCRVCMHSYTAHAEAARGFGLEDMSHLHSPNCRSRIVNKASCNCMNIAAKQILLDAMSDRPRECPEFRPIGDDTQTQMMCKCSKRFYDHSAEARSHFTLWSQWRMSKMTNKDVIHWFINLGHDDLTRVTAFRSALESTSDIDPVAPSKAVLKVIEELLPVKLKALLGPLKRQHLPGCLGSVSCKCPVPRKVKSLIVVEDAQCYQCKQPLLPTERQICGACTDKLVIDMTPMTAPRPSRQAATEPSINRDGDWDGFTD